MNCPHCQQELPKNALATLCPFCHADLPLPIFQSAWVNWPKIFILLVAPAACCFLAILINVTGFAVLAGLFGSLAAGIVSSRMIMEGLNLTGWRRGLTHFILAFCLCGLAWFLCFLGCTGGSSVSNHSL